MLIAELGLNTALFKLTLFINWLPYALIALSIIKRDLKEHVFVIGMEFLWSLMLHSISTSTSYILLHCDALSSSEVLYLHNALCMTLFLILIRWERRLFLNILPSRYFFDNPFGWHAAILPLAIALGSSLLMADAHYPHDLREQLSRVVIPLFFFLVYRSMSISTRLIDEKNEREHINGFINQRLEALRKYNLIMQEHQKRLAIFRHDRRHNYRLISAMLDSGDVDKAITLIEKPAEK